jgi:hypothetical protein
VPDKAFHVNSPSCPKLNVGLKELVTGGQNALFLQETLLVVLAGTAPKSIDLEQ